MAFNLDNRHEKINVIIGNIKMKFPKFSIINHCPNWINEISNEKKIIINPNLFFDLNGVKDFFDGISTNSFKITLQNCKTIANLAKLSGSKEIYKNATKFINENLKSISDVMEEIINQKPELKNNNNGFTEIDNENKIIYLAQHYNELLQYPDLLKNIEVHKHYNILQLALKLHDKNDFNLHGLFSFVINLLKKGNNQMYSVLLSLFDPTEFNIDEIEQLINCKNFDKSFLNFKTISFLTIIKQNREKIKEQGEKISKLQNQYDEIKKMLIDYQKEMNDFNKRQSKKIDQIMNEHNSKLQEIINDNKQNIENQHKTQDILQKQYEEIKNNQKLINNEIKLKTQQLLDDHKSKFENILKDNKANIQAQQNFQDNIKTQCNEVKKTVQSSQKSFTEQINQIQKDQIKKYNEMKVVIENNQKSLNEQINKTQQTQKEQLTNQYDEIKKLIEKQHKSSNELVKKSCTDVGNNLNDFIKSNLKNKIEDINIKLKENQKSFNSAKINYYEIYDISKVLKNMIQFMPIKFDATSEYGIFEDYYHQFNKNPFNDGLIEISGNSDSIHTVYDLQNITNTNKSSFNQWKSENDKDSYIMVDFKKRKFRFKGIIVSNLYTGNDYLRGILIEGKNDLKSTWETTGTNNMKDYLVEPGSLASGWTNDYPNKYYKYIRLKMTTPNADGKYIIALRYFDLFGRLE